MILYTLLRDIGWSIKGKTIVEIGLGSGFVLQNLKNNLDYQNDNIFLGIDINTDSCLYN